MSAAAAAPAAVSEAAAAAASSQASSAAITAAADGQLPGRVAHLGLSISYRLSASMEYTPYAISWDPAVSVIVCCAACALGTTTPLLHATPSSPRVNEVSILLYLNKSYYLLLVLSAELPKGAQELSVYCCHTAIARRVVDTDVN
jgi:hypothetical protein